MEIIYGQEAEAAAEAGRRAVLKQVAEDRMHRADELFHKLWGKAVGTEDYDKKQWCELQAFINKWVAKDRIEQTEHAHEFEKYH
jgi:hypothetical protein